MPHLLLQAEAATRGQNAKLNEVLAEKTALLEALHTITAENVDPTSGSLYKHLYTDAMKRIAAMEDELEAAGGSSVALAQALARIQELENLLEAERAQNSGIDARMLEDTEAALAAMEREAAERSRAHEAALKAATERLKPALEAALARINELEEMLAQCREPACPWMFPHVLVPTAPGSPYLHPVPVDSRTGMIISPSSPVLRATVTSPVYRSRSPSSWSAQGSNGSPRMIDGV